MRDCCGAFAMTIRPLNSRVVYRNPWMTVREDAIERDNGTRGIYGVVEKCDSAIILAIDGDSIYLVEQYRYPIAANSLEFPQGGLERNDVDPAEIAREELHAETGLIAEKLDCLGAIHIACGYANQKTYAFLATGLTQSAGQRDAEEHDLMVRKVSLAELEQLIRKNVIKDAQTMAAWALYQACATELRGQP
jgi:8-oxo-dGTP pyrophosphatase MutT (NUDIX family)